MELRQRFKKKGSVPFSGSTIQLFVWYNPTVTTIDSQFFGDSEALRQRSESLSTFAEWDRENPVVMDPTRAVAAVASLYRLIPADARRREDDPDFEGVGRMLDALARLGRSRG